MVRIPRTRMPVFVCSSLLLAAPVLSAQTSTVANVYVQGKSGVYVYSANSSGKLAPISGSPFPDTGQMEGINGSYLISVGTTYLHSYKILANGAVGAHAAQINTASYGGGACGGTSGPSLLDHTGQYFAVQLTGASSTNGCAALQTYKIASSGQFTFLGDTESTDGYHGAPYNLNVGTYSSNNLFAYGVQSQVYANEFLAFKRASAGDLVTDTQFSQTGPTPNPSYASNEGNYFPNFVAADGSGHLAAVMNTPFAPNSSTFQLASFTINSTTGAITSTNTYANMPVLKSYPNAIGMSWTGNLVAVGEGPGLQIFHFNGGAPPTAFGSVLLPSIYISQVAWDKSNHLYALSYSSQQLYVYTVTPTSIAPAAGSPYKVNAPYGWIGLIVVPSKY